MTRPRHKITVDVPKVQKDNLNLPLRNTRAPASEHKTEIEIRKLHRKLTGRSLGKARIIFDLFTAVATSRRIARSES